MQDKYKHHQGLIHRIDLDIVGGAEISFAQYAEYLQRMDARDAVVVDEYINPHFRGSVGAPLRVISRTEFKRWLGVRIPRFARTLRARNAIRCTAQGDECAVLSWNKIGNREIADVAAFAGLPLIHYEHGMAWSPIMRHVADFLRQVDGVIANSRAAERVLALNWGWHGPTRRVYCAVDSALPIEAARNELHRGDPLWIGCAGRLVELKGHRVALHAIKLLRDKHHVDARLVIAGTGENATELRRETERLGLRKFVVFNGHVKEMAEFYCRIDLLLVPSLRESFGRTSVEAQGYGCPVIVAGIDGLPETLPPAATGRSVVVPEWSLDEYVRELGGDVRGIGSWAYCPQEDSLIRPRALAPDRVAAAVMGLTKTDAIYHRASREGLEHVHEHFMVADYGPKIDNAIKQIKSS